MLKKELDAKPEKKCTAKRRFYLPGSSVFTTGLTAMLKQNKSKVKLKTIFETLYNAGIRQSRLCMRPLFKMTLGV